MKLVGSRATNEFDIFSDWDFHIDSEQDFEQIASRLTEAVAWSIVKRGNLCIVTVIDPSGTMWDFSGNYEQHRSGWERLGTPSPQDRPVYDYWILALKNLKGMYRGFNEFVSVGIEMSTGLARDIYLGRQYGLYNFKNFYAYKQIAHIVEADDRLSQVTGLVYTTAAEKLTKLQKLNELVLDVSTDVSARADHVFQLRVGDLEL